MATQVPNDNVLEIERAEYALRDAYAGDIGGLRSRLQRMRHGEVMNVADAARLLLRQAERNLDDRRREL